MKIPIKLRDKNQIPQPMTKKPWEKGFLVDSIRGGNNRPFGLILTEHGEFEMAPLYAIEEDRKKPSEKTERRCIRCHNLIIDNENECRDCGGAASIAV